MPAQTVIKVRRDTAANWISADPTLASGEIGFETDTNQLKVGNGSSAWTALDYTSGGASVEISETAPASPDEGNVWFNSTEGRAYIYYDSVWVDLNPGIAGPPGATGETGIVIQASEPASTDVLWLDTDEVADVPVPAGGTDGQVLTKTSGVDYATAWEDIPEGTAVVYSATAPVDTSAIWYSTENGNAYVYYDDFWTSISGRGIPAGGAAGQVLAKSTSADYATQWVAPGKILQVASTVLTTAFSSASTTFTDLTGLSVSITPTSAASKILVFLNVYTSFSAAGDVLVNIVRNSTAISQSTGATHNTTMYGQVDSNNGIANATSIFLDSPATTSATTYKAQMRVLSGTGWINRRASDTTFGATSSITVMEVAG